MPRRTVLVRLTSTMERPEERQDFQHPDILEWVKQERGRLLAAALTILRGYWVAGRPDQGLKPWGSFESWSNLVCSSVVWVGFEDPGETRSELATRANAESQALAALMTALMLIDPGAAGLTAAEIIHHATDEKTRTNESAELIREALGALCPGTAGTPTPGSLGKHLGHLRKRVVGGRFLESRLRNHASCWYVVSNPSEHSRKKGDTGDQGDNFPPSQSKSKATPSKRSRKQEQKSQQAQNISRISPISLPGDYEVL